MTTTTEASAPASHATVMASAGTGKTWLLITRLIRLLLHGAAPGSILAVTFTRKAASEMQVRLHERLLELLALDDAALGAALGALGAAPERAALSHARALFEDLLRDPHPLRTTTFHAFCQDILRRFPLDAEVPPGFELLEAEGLVAREAREALLAEATADPCGAPARALETLLAQCNTVRAFEDALDEFLAQRSDWQAYTQGQDDPAAYAQTRLAAQLGIDAARDPYEGFFTAAVREEVGEFRTLLERHDTETNREHGRALGEHLADGARAARFAAAARAFLTGQGEPRRRPPSKTRERLLGAAGQQRLLELNDRLTQRVLETRDRARRHACLALSGAWYAAGSRLLHHYRKIKDERRLLDFQDLEWRTYLLLNHSENAHWIQFKLDQRIDHFLIDEFQDTNPTQWRLLLPLLRELAADPRGRSVFLVGDAKQSIYRFRRADPRLFDAARAWLDEHLAGRSYPLNESWRSARAITDFVNRVFGSDALAALVPGFPPHDTHRDELWGRVELLPLIRARDAAPRPDETELRDPLAAPRVVAEDERRRDEGRLIAERITRLIGEGAPVQTTAGCRALRYEDILLLVRSRTHVHAYEEALRDAGIPYLGSSRATLLDSLEIQDMVALLETLVSPYGNLALACTLRTPLFACGDDDLARIALAARAAGGGTWFDALDALDLDPDSPLGRARRRLAVWRALAARLPVHDLLDRIYCEGDALARYRAAFPPHLAARVAANLNRFIELALELDSGRYPSLTRFLALLRELQRGAERALDEPPAAAPQAVRILTVHGAKGLEAPVVFLADSARRPRARAGLRALIDWPAEAERPSHFLLSGGNDGTDDYTRRLLEQAAADERREEANLLYVALTRARQYLFITGCAPRKTSDLGWYGAIRDALPAGADAGYCAASGPPPPRPPAPDAATPAVLPLDPALARPPPAPAPDAELAPSRAAEERPGGGSGAAAAARRRGIAIHRMLERLTAGGDAAVDIAPAVARELGLEPGSEELRAWWAEARAVAGAAHLQPFFDPLCYAAAYNEVPVSYLEEGRLIHGVIDRVVIHDGAVALIDYKTQPAAAAAGLETLAAPYRGQLVRYREAVRRLWPDKTVRSLLIFTACAAAYEFPQDASASAPDA